MRGFSIYSALDSLYIPTTWKASMTVSTSPVASMVSTLPEADNIRLKPTNPVTPPEVL